MIKIRLARAGRKKNPFYKIVVANIASPRDGRFIERIGSYDPLLEGDSRITLKKERAEYWLSVGAVPTDRVSIFLNNLAVKGAEKYKLKFIPKQKGENSKQKKEEK